MVFWVLVLLYFGWFAWFVGSNLTFAQSYEYQIALALVVPLIYGVACLAYFWTNGVRKYFRVKT
jgi:membrane protein DedA with SNARE-associated domain